MSPPLSVRGCSEPSSNVDGPAAEVAPVADRTWHGARHVPEGRRRRKGLLSGAVLYLDVKRTEMAYHENNKRELALAKHVSLRQLNPVALLTLKATGSCTVTIPEWLYDLDCPGHYMRRIKSVARSIPSVVGPYTSVKHSRS